MSEQVKIQKTIYGLQSFNNVINTDFSELITTGQPTSSASPDMTVPQFFNEYDILFYEIPPSGSDDSHLALATRSLEYIGVSLDDLQNEITELREENVDLKNQILLASQINPGTLI